MTTGQSRPYHYLKMRSAIRIVAVVLFAAALPLLLLSTNLRIMVGADWYYERGFSHHDVSETTGIPDGELDSAADKLISYLNGSSDTPQMIVTKHGQSVELFTQRELDHLRDVKAIVQLFYLAQWISLGCTAALVAAGFYQGRKAFFRPLARWVTTSALCTTAVFAFFGIWAAIDFDSLFRIFHLASFSNDLWQLDPSRHHLIMMFPEGFFMEAALVLIGGTLGQMAILTGFALFYLRRTRRQIVSSMA